MTALCFNAAIDSSSRMLKAMAMFSWVCLFVHGKQGKIDVVVEEEKLHLFWDGIFDFFHL
jgi:hypothetical protein